MVPGLRQGLALGAAEVATQWLEVRAHRVDGSHATRGHGLQGVVGEAFHVGHQAADGRPHHGGRRGRVREERDGEVVGHAQQLALETRVVQQELGAYLARQPARVVRQVQDDPGTE